MIFASMQVGKYIITQNILVAFRYFGAFRSLYASDIDQSVKNR